MINAWSTEDCAAAAEIFAAERGVWGGRKKAVALIAAKLNRTKAAVGQRLHVYGVKFAGPARAVICAPPAGRAHPPGPPTFVPARVAAERDHRKLLTAASLTAELMGDPPPGYSALDRKRAAEMASS